MNYTIIFSTPNPIMDKYINIVAEMLPQIIRQFTNYINLIRLQYIKEEMWEDRVGAEKERIATKMNEIYSLIYDWSVFEMWELRRKTMLLSVKVSL